MISAPTEKEKKVMAMSEYIERDALRDAVEFIDWYSVYKGNLIAGSPSSADALYKANDIYSAIDNAPAADVIPERHGRWLGWGKSGTPTYENYGTCSVCGKDAEIYTEHRNYCPNCGAKMDLE